MAKKTKTVLVVDDEVILVDMIRLRLEANGYRVESAHDGREGLAKAQIVRPDLIILDIGMAGMDGYTMLKELRKHKKLKYTRVVMLTASGRFRDRFEKEGISDYIVKPFDTEDFISRIKKTLKD